MNKEATYFLKFDVNKYKIKIDKKNWPQFALSFIIIWTLAERFLVQIGLPSSIIYLIDLINVFLFVATVKKKKWNRFYPMMLAYIGLLSCGVLSAIINYGTWGESPLFTLFEVRNVVRFPVFFLASVTFLKESDIEKVFKILTVFFYANFVMITYQYITYHPVGVWTRGDHLNGFFGTSVGGNTFVNALMLCVVVYWLCKWRNRECPMWKFLLPLGMSITIAALIELKVYFVEVVILYIWYFVSQKKTFKELAKNFIIIIAALIVAYYTLQFMYEEYPWFKETMSLKGMLDLASDSSGYTGTSDLNRLTGIFTIGADFFDGDIADILSGIGLGNGSVFSLGGDYTKFCRMYESTHYSWFSATYIFVQCGLFGLVMYISTFVILFMKKKNNKYSLLSQTMIFLALLLIVYNETLKTDAGYFIYFAIASGFVAENSEEFSRKLSVKNKKSA